MKEFFTTTIGAWDDGSVRLTAPGIAVVVVIIALLVVVAKSDPPQKCREKNNSHHKTACLLCRCDRACSSMLHD